MDQDQMRRIERGADRLKQVSFRDSLSPVSLFTPKFVLHSPSRMSRKSLEIVVARSRRQHDDVLPFGSQPSRWGLYGILTAPAHTWESVTEADIGQEWVQFLLDEAEKGTAPPSIPPPEAAGAK